MSEADTHLARLHEYEKLACLCLYIQISAVTSSIAHQHTMRWEYLVSCLQLSWPCRNGAQFLRAVQIVRVLRSLVGVWGQPMFVVVIAGEIDSPMLLWFFQYTWRKLPG
jgi:hypothetical protein